MNATSDAKPGATGVRQAIRCVWGKIAGFPGHAWRGLTSETAARGVQTLAIVLGGGWAVWSFGFKEYWQPKSAPVNITMNLQLKKTEEASDPSAAQEDRPTGVEMKIAASNPSARMVYLLPSVWIAYGCNIEKIDSSDENAFQNDVVQTLNEPLGVFFNEKYFSRTHLEVVAAGGLFGDTSLKPAETITRTLVLSLPAHGYDILQVYSYMPTVKDATTVKTEWRLVTAQDSSTPRLALYLYRVAKDGKFKLISVDAKGRYVEEALDLQEAYTSSELSLTRRGAPSATGQTDPWKSVKETP